MDRKIKNIGIVGAGLVGASWAAFYAGKGFGVKLYDVSESARQNGCKKAAEHLTFLKDQGMLLPENFKRAVAALKVADSLAEAVQNVELVQESVAERYEIKKEVFEKIGLHTSADVIVASSTSALSISDIQQNIRHPQRSLTAHPFNPPHLIPLVELVPGKNTDKKTIADMKIFLERLGKVPVVLNKEVPGHIANRFQAAVWREAVDMVINGVASVEDVDRALCAGPGIRWALLGPHLLFHLGGGKGGIEYLTDHIGVVYEEIWQSMARWTSLPAETKDVVVEGIKKEMGERTFSEIVKWRDDKLVKLLKILYT